MFPVRQADALFGHLEVTENQPPGFIGDGNLDRQVRNVLLVALNLGGEVGAI